MLMGLVARKGVLPRLTRSPEADPTAVGGEGRDGWRDAALPSCHFLSCLPGVSDTGALLDPRECGATLWIAAPRPVHPGSLPLRSLGSSFHRAWGRGGRWGRRGARVRGSTSMCPAPGVVRDSGAPVPSGLVAQCSHCWGLCPGPPLGCRTAGGGSRGHWGAHLRGRFCWLVEETACASSHLEVRSGLGSHQAPGELVICELGSGHRGPAESQRAFRQDPCVSPSSPGPAARRPAQGWASPSRPPALICPQP